MSDDFKDWGFDQETELEKTIVRPMKAKRREPELSEFTAPPEPPKAKVPLKKIVLGLLIAAALLALALFFFRLGANTPAPEPKPDPLSTSTSDCRSLSKATEALSPRMTAGSLFLPLLATVAPAKFVTADTDCCERTPSSRDGLASPASMLTAAAASIQAAFLMIALFIPYFILSFLWTQLFGSPLKPGQMPADRQRAAVRSCLCKFAETCIPIFILSDNLYSVKQ